MFQAEKRGLREIKSKGYNQQPPPYQALPFILEGKASLGPSACISSARAVSCHGHLYLKKKLKFKYFTYQPLWYSEAGDNVVEMNAEPADLRYLPGQVLSQFYR